MQNYEVPEPIINTPFDEPGTHWYIAEGESPERRPGRRPAMYFFRDPKSKSSTAPAGDVGVAIELKLVNRIRERVKAWREQGYPGVTRTTHELLEHWRRDGREVRLFFAQREAAETVIFLTEARADFRQGIVIPRDEPSDDKRAEGYSGFARYACKMATGSGKTTVMAMLAAWSILNKANDRSDGRFSEVVLVVCPNVTIRNRLEELKPEHGEASVYRTRDLVPPHLMPHLSQGRVQVTNWHVFEPQAPQTGGESARVTKSGVPVRVQETITIGPKTTTARGGRYLTLDAYQSQVAAGRLRVIAEEHDTAGNLKKVRVEALRYVESDTSVVNRILGREVGGKQNILVLNDEAHHAYRIKREEPDAEEADMFEDESEAEDFFKEATVWIDGLDRVQKLRGINFCVDLSATPYFLGRVGQETNRPFPWVVSDFGLIDAIESGLVKIPQLAVRDTTGAPIPGYFNIWHWILPQLTSAERGARRTNPKPEAILKYAHHPIAMLGGLWEELRREWEQNAADPRPPVFIIVCKTTLLAKTIYEWLADVDFWTSRDVREVARSHLNYVVADTAKWEQSAAYHIDKHPATAAFVKNAGLGFAIPYLHNGQMHDYVPDFIIQLDSELLRYLIREVKGYDPLEEVKRAAAERWVAAVNADGTHGAWHFAMAKKVSEVTALIAAVATGRRPGEA